MQQRAIKGFPVKESPGGVVDSLHEEAGGKQHQPKKIEPWGNKEKREQG